MTKHDTYYYERYAKLTLEKSFPEWKSHFSKVDRPDLQNESENIGIEVTSSTPSQIREADSYGMKLLGKKVADEEEKKFWGYLFLSPERVAMAYSATKGSVDSDISPQIIAAIAHKRDVWIEKGYKDFQIRGVYIFTGTSIIDSEMLEKA